jgi:Lon protease-like protein
MTQAPVEEIPLFPLNTVLFPGGPLPLRIFETRYVDMVRSCLRSDSPFGVLLIREGAEAGGAAATVQVGTRARIVDFNPMPDGLLGIICRGESRFRLLERWRQADGLNIGRVQSVPQPPVTAVPEQYRHLADLLRRVLPELGSLYASIPRSFDDADWVSGRLAEILPLEQQEKQQLLELEDPVERLALLDPHIQQADDDAQPA